MNIENINSVISDSQFLLKIGSGQLINSIEIFCLLEDDAKIEPNGRFLWSIKSDRSAYIAISQPQDE